MTTPAQKASVAFLPRRYQFFAEEGVAVLLQPSRLGDGGSLVTTAATVYAPATTAPDKSAAKSPSAPGVPATRSVSPWTLDCPPITPQVNVAAEHYNRPVRMLEQGETLRVAIELQADFHPEDPMVANTLAEIPGSDLADELVTLGAHLDSWHSGTGSTDNVPFDAVGLPGFQFIQDQIEYRTKTHHANMDVYDRASIDDLKQAAVIMAAFVYQTAMRDEKIPRKPLPAQGGVSSAGKAAPASAKK